PLGNLGYWSKVVRLALALHCGSHQALLFFLPLMIPRHEPDIPHPLPLGFRVDLNLTERSQGAGELIRMDRVPSLLPGINVGIHRGLDIPIQSLTDPLGIIHQYTPELIDSDALDKVVGPLLVLAMLAVVLHKASHA